MLARRGVAKSFGRVRLTHDELQESNSTIDFAELIEKQAAGRVREPAPEEEVAVRRPEANVPAQLQTMKNDGIAGDDMSDGEDDDDTAKNSKLGRKGIYEDIIAKWSSLNHGLGGDGGGSDNGDDRSGGDADDASDESNEYDYDDELIDNSELLPKFKSRAIAKHKHKRQRNEGSGFYMTHNDIDDDMEEDEDQDEGQDEDDEADQDGDQDEENLGDNGVARTQDATSRIAEKNPRSKVPRKRRAKWIAPGDRNFRDVEQVQQAIRDRLGGSDAQKLKDGLTDDNVKAIVQIFEIAEFNQCAGDKLLEWVGEKLERKGAWETKIRTAFTIHKVKVSQKPLLDALHLCVEKISKSSQAVVTVNGSEFATCIADLIRNTQDVQVKTVKKKQILLDLFKETIRKTRLLQDKTSRERLERHVKEEVMLRIRDVLPDEAMRNEFGDKLESLRNAKLNPAEAPAARRPPVGGGGIGGAFAGGGGVMGPSRMPNLPCNTTQSVSNQRRPFKNNVFDPLPQPK